MAAKSSEPRRTKHAGLLTKAGSEVCEAALTTSFRVTMIDCRLRLTNRSPVISSTFAFSSAAGESAIHKLKRTFFPRNSESEWAFPAQLDSENSGAATGDRSQ